MIVIFALVHVLRPHPTVLLHPLQQSRLDRRLVRQEAHVGSALDHELGSFATHLGSSPGGRMETSEGGRGGLDRVLVGYTRSILL